MKLLLDTNVWLDYYIDRSVRHDRARYLVVRASELDIDLFVSIGSVKDCYFLLSRELKRMAVADGKELSQETALAADETAWACIANMRRQATIVPADEGDLVEAMILRSKHHDLEDNLVVAAALRAQSNYLVTEDKRLLAHRPVACLDIEGAIAAMEN